MRDVYANGHGPNWIAALNAKFANKGIPFGRKEFDEVLGDFSVCSPLLDSLHLRTYFTFPGVDVPRFAYQTLGDFLSAHFICVTRL
jgi:hypothetical protein